MTREKAIKILECMAVDLTGALADTKEPLADVLRQRLDAIDVAQAALTPPTQEQVEKVRRGYWNHKEVVSNKSIIGKFLLPSCECSLCGCYVQQEVNFCPECGARMDKEDRDG